MTSTPQPDQRAIGRRLTVEIWIVLGLSLGRSGIYAVVDIVARLTAGPPLAQQTATLNASQSPRPYLDLTYQLLSIGFALVCRLAYPWRSKVVQLDPQAHVDRTAYRAKKSKKVF